MDKNLSGENRSSAATFAELVEFRTLPLSHRTGPDNIAA